MNSLLIMNWLAAIAVIAYAGYLFVYLIRTRMAYIQLGKKIEFDRRFKERWDLLKVNVFGQKKLLKDKKERHYSRYVLLRIYSCPIWSN